MYMRSRITRAILLVGLIMAQRAEWLIAIGALALAGLVHLLWRGSWRSLGRDVAAFAVFYGLLELTERLSAGDFEF
jgi:hypothetical protein